ncbi:MAG: hypothetical protein V1691_02725 [Chloroflexota bacterium]
MAKILGFTAGILLLILLIAMFLPIPAGTKMIAIIYIWIALIVFTGVSAVAFLPNMAVKIASGVITAALIGWAIIYGPSIASTLLG